MRGKDKSASVKLMYPDDVRDYLSEHQGGAFTLLDVRQPFEYEQAHLPGAKLIPLPRLADSLRELDPAKPVIVYCAVGGRSSVAAQLLSNQGFKDVVHLVGGIEAWEGRTAEGPVEFHLQFMPGDETPEETIRIAFRMEEGMRKFHQLLQDRSTDPQVKELLTHLIRAEEGHKKRLLDILSQETSEFRIDMDEDSELMEGGFSITDFVKQNESFLRTLSGVLHVAMMVETQALDLYLRMADTSTNETTKRALFQIAEEEKSHLDALGRVMEEKLGPS